MQTMTISLPTSMREFVEEQLVSGRFRSPSDYLRTLIRAEQKRAARKRTETLILEGINSGEATTMTPEDWAQLRERARQRASRDVLTTSKKETLAALPGVRL